MRGNVYECTDARMRQLVHAIMYECMRTYMDEWINACINDIVCVYDIVCMSRFGNEKVDWNRPIFFFNKG